MEDWKIVILEHDNGSKEVGDFFETIWSDGVIRKNIEGDVLYSKVEVTNKIKEAIGDLEGKILTIYGHGGYHHYTYGLCNVLARKKSQNYAYIQIDHHADSYTNKGGSIGCGSFVTHILKTPRAKEIIYLGTVGSIAKGSTILSQKSLTSEDTKKILEEVLRNKPQPDVYPSLDLDILKKEEVLTSYDRGNLRLKHLLDILDVIQQEKNVISADILGYVNKPEQIYLIPISLLTYATLAAKITEKDTKDLIELHSYFKEKIGYSKDLTIFQKLHRSIKREFGTGVADYIKEFEKITEQLRI